MNTIIPRLKGWLDFYRGNNRGSLSEPMNGQLGRQRIFRALASLLPAQAFIETGTFRGTTTEFMAGLADCPIYTVEAVPRFFYFSRLRFRKYPRIHLSLGDSRSFLQKLARDPAVPKNKVLFYLDAHWTGDLPLAEEVEIIAGAWTQSIVMIDDFEVPGDPGYTFDDYGPGRRLCLDYFAPSALSTWAVFFPAMPSAEETGARRGCAVLAAPALETSVAALPLLRRHTSTPATAGK